MKIIKEICFEEDITLRTYSDDYILYLCKNGKSTYIYGNKFANNSASAEMICDDKAGLSELLASFNIPHVHHKYFANPSQDWYCSERETDRRAMGELLKKYPDGVVVKDNKGTGGINVFRATSENELFSAAEKIFEFSPALAICPYEKIKHEYRVLMIENEYIYAFEKLRRSVTGNGINTIEELLSAKYGKQSHIEGEIGKTVPENGETVFPEWRHNLGQGAIPELVKDEKLAECLAGLAEKCMSLLKLGFASVDIIETDKGMSVLEINSGVMIDNFSAYSDEYYLLAKNAVKKATELCLL